MKHQRKPLLLVAYVFLFVGAIICMNDILLPSLKNFFHLSILAQIHDVYVNTLFVFTPTVPTSASLPSRVGRTLYPSLDKRTEKRCNISGLSSTNRILGCKTVFSSEIFLNIIFFLSIIFMTYLLSIIFD